MMGTGGGSHSDIFREPIGRLTWDLVGAYAASGQAKGK
ncbi:hypothetical protein MCP1_510015 [Candidatus Terasakiella magnetica]|nr:hypothetical protein MCP1_510015 [Candidatus Terasakiella magnetica]